MNDNNFEQRCIDRLIELGNPNFHDQDVLNSLYCNDIKWFEVNWNVEWHLAFDYLNVDYIMKQNNSPLIKKYLSAYKNPKIIHYSSDIKPWQFPNIKLADYFWKYAKNTPFYQEILRNIKQDDSHIDKNSLSKFKFKLYKYL